MTWLSFPCHPYVSFSFFFTRMLWRPSKRCNVYLPNACSPHFNQDVTFKIFSNPLSICSHTCFLRENFKDAVVMSLGENLLFFLESKLLFLYVAACYYGNPLLVAPCYPFSMTPMENSFRKVDYTCSKSLQGVWMCLFFLESWQSLSSFLESRWIPIQKYIYIYIYKLETL